MLQGHQHNRDLAQRRADRVVQMFIDKGVPANQIRSEERRVGKEC